MRSASPVEGWGYIPAPQIRLTPFSNARFSRLVQPPRSQVLGTPYQRGPPCRPGLKPLTPATPIFTNSSPPTDASLRPF